MNSYLLIPHIKIHNANALSSPFTIGFPAMTAWLGAVHALQRKINDRGFSIVFGGVGISCHKFDLQTYRGENDFVSSIIGTANPVDKNGARPAFIEEARCHLNVSLAIELPALTQLEIDQLLSFANDIFASNLKMAAGDILGFNPIEIITDFQRLLQRLSPGYVITERRDLMQAAMEEGQDALDAMLDYLAVHYRCEQTEDGEIEWHAERKPAHEDGSKGWIVPVATGFHGISVLGTAKNQRDPEAPHRFAESLVTLGEFKMPYKFDLPDELFWHYEYQEENNFYLCKQHQSTSQVEGF